MSWILPDLSLVAALDGTVRDVGEPDKKERARLRNKLWYIRTGKRKSEYNKNGSERTRQWRLRNPEKFKAQRRAHYRKKKALGQWKQK